MGKSRRKLFALLFAAACANGLGVLHAAEDAAVVETTHIQSIVNSYCISCHGAEKSEGDLRLDQFATKHWNDYGLFDEVVTRIADGEMPPDDAEKPLPKGERAMLLEQLTSRLSALEDAQLPGTYKKLTAEEYNNTLADVLDAPLDKVRNLPFDSDDDFKKLGEHQLVTSYAVKKYYNVAQEYLDQHILVERPPVETVTYTPLDNPKQWIHTSRFNGTRLGPIIGSGNAPTFMLRSPVATFAGEGEYEFTFDWRAFYLSPPKYRFDPEMEYRPGEPIGMPTLSVPGDIDVLNAVMRGRGERSDYRVRFDEPIRMVLDRQRKFIPIRTNTSFNNASLHEHNYDFLGKYVELLQDHQPPPNKSETEEEKQARRERETKEDKLHVLITGVTIRGPLNKAEPAMHARLFGSMQRTDAFDACVPIIRRLAQQLFRRPVSDDVLQNYVAIAQAEYEDTHNTYAAIKVALNAMLCSPHFVFKYEGNELALDDYMIASRLSYFLWNSSPDEELLTLAAEGKLKDPVIRREQALRMLNDRAKSERFTQNFTYQWLGLDKFGQFAPNQAYLEPGKYAQLQPHIAREPQEFFNEILYGNLSALNFIDSDFVVWNRQLYQTYFDKSLKIAYDRDLPGDQWQRMALQENPDRTRGGLPTMGAIMSLTTDGENTQPILRGVWIARRMLGTEIEAPATVPAIEINLENVSKPREVLAKHKEDKSCYACHVKFDYLGLAMENYDVLGRFKTEYVHPVIDEKGRPQLITKDPIDSLSETPAGEAMPGVAGLKAHLMANKETVIRNLFEKLFSYAYGREVRYGDRDQLNVLLKGMRENDYKLQDGILALIESDSFAHR